MDIIWVGCGLFITALHITEQRRISAQAVLLLMINNSSYFQIYALTTIIFRRRKILPPRWWQLHRMIPKKACIFYEYVIVL
jgi:hypothetical protein